MEDFKIKYENALSIMKDVHSMVLGEARQRLEEAFPELAESKSEDGKIRKAIKNALILKSSVNSLTHDGVKLGNAIAWLEKQGEQKSIDPDTLIQQRVDALADIVAEQNPVDKVEPKFKVGDWIVSNTSNLVYRVDSILFPQSKCYYLSHNGGIVIVSFNDEQNYHLWTIQDAKDGDVLVASDKSLFIYNRNINENSNVGFYLALIEDMDIIIDSDDDCGWEEKDSCYPATKEQRDTLTKAMADAGWEFDFEKKELRKIEQKPVEWSEEDETKRADSMYLIGQFRKCLATDECSIQMAQDCVNWLKSLRPQNT